MRLSEFILQNLDSIMAEWERFARTLTPGRDMRSADLRNDSEQMLRAIALDIESTQTEREQADKAHGKAPHAVDPSAAQEHGLHRFAQSFSLLETLSEFRALRATVTRLWLQSNVNAGEGDLLQLIRFNEAIDQALTESTAQVVAALDRNRDLFLSTISHDLRNPLQAIDISANVFTKSTDLTPSQQQTAERIAGATKRMEQIVDQLREFTSARLRQPLMLKPKPCRLVEVVDRCVAELQISNQNRRIEVTARGDTGGIWDSSRLAQLFVNVIGNALEHGSDDFQEPIEVEIVGNGQVDAWVINAGPPIPVAERAFIFEPMRRGKASLERPGSLGLGLYIARQIAEAHGGSLELASSDGRKTVFHVSLPKTPRAPPVLTPPSVSR